MKKDVIAVSIIGLVMFLVVIGLFGWLFAPPAWGAESSVTFAWDANTETDLVGYRIYQSNTSGVYVFGPDNCAADITKGTETATITGVGDGIWYWVVTAYDEAGNESGPSNELSASLDTVSPGSPVNVRITLVVKVEVGE